MLMAPQNVLTWLYSGQISFPENLEVLLLPVWPTSSGASKLSLEDQRDVVAALSRLYPLLRETRLGYPANHWDRKGALWKRRGFDEYIEVYL